MRKDKVPGTYERWLLHLPGCYGPINRYENVKEGIKFWLRGGGHMANKHQLRDCFFMEGVPYWHHFRNKIFNEKIICAFHTFLLSLWLFWVLGLPSESSGISDLRQRVWGFWKVANRRMGIIWEILFCLWTNKYVMLYSYPGTGGGVYGVRTKEDSQLYNGAPAVLQHHVASGQGYIPLHKISA